jgi:hypothetical protein
MRKLAIFALILGLVVAFSVPAMAFRIEGPKDTKFYFGGTLLTDTAARYNSKERTAAWGNTDSRTEFILDAPYHSNIHGIVEAGNTGFYWEIRYGRDFQFSHEQADAAMANPAAGAADKNNRLNYIEGAQFYGWYKFGNCQIQAGKHHGWMFSVVPYQNLGANQGHIFGFGYGAFYDDRSMRISFVQNVNKTFSWQIAAVQPFYTDVNVTATNQYSATPVVGSRNVDSYAEYPLLAAKATINLGPVSLFPGAAWMDIKFKDVPSGWDDSITWFNTWLQARFTAGPFVATGSINYGQNLGLGGGALSTYQNPLGAPSWSVNGRVRNARNLAGFIDLGFKAGMATPHFYFGYDRVSNTDAWTVGNDFNDRWMLGASAQLAISSNFNIVPEISYYKYGEAPNNTAKPSLGDEWLAGMQFQFLF